MGRKMMAALRQHPRFRVVAAWDPDANTLQAALQSRLPFAVNFPIARGTASRRMQETVRGGDLGPITSASVRLRFARWPREVHGKRGSVALPAGSRLEYQGHASERVDNTAHTLDGLAALLEGRADHGLATVDEATSVVRCIESMLRP